MYVCVSCLCRPPSHWWISFIFYTIIGLDPEGGQWLFKLQSYNNKKQKKSTKESQIPKTPIYPADLEQYMWDCSNSRVLQNTGPSIRSNMTWRVCCVCMQVWCSAVVIVRTVHNSISAGGTHGYLRHFEIGKNCRFIFNNERISTSTRAQGKGAGKQWY